MKVANEVPELPEDVKQQMDVNSTRPAWNHFSSYQLVVYKRKEETSFLTLRSVYHRILTLTHCLRREEEWSRESDSFVLLHGMRSSLMKSPILFDGLVSAWRHHCGSQYAILFVETYKSRAAKVLILNYNLWYYSIW